MLKHVLAHFYVFSPYLGVGHNLLMQFSRLGSSKMELSKN